MYEYVAMNFVLAQHVWSTTWLSYPFQALLEFSVRYLYAEYRIRYIFQLKYGYLVHHFSKFRV